MPSNYPASLDSFTNPSGTQTLASPDHALQHSNDNDAIVALETTAGTTAGTNVLKNFAAGNFPARINASNVLQQNLQGTLNNSVVGTPVVTGGTATNTVITTGTINNSVVGTPTITGGTANSLVGTATTNNLNAKGLHSATTVVDVSAATAPSANQVLTATSATAATWQTLGALSSKVVSFTRDLATASGTVAYTGVGFQPTSIHLLATGVNAIYFSDGFADSARSGNGRYFIDATHAGAMATDVTANCVVIVAPSSGNSNYGTVDVYSADGFSISWTKQGSPTGTAYLMAICYR